MQCPICKKRVEEPTAEHPQAAYPFCSERCKVVDLGRWLEGGYQITVTEDAKDPIDEDEENSLG